MLMGEYKLYGLHMGSNTIQATTTAEKRYLPRRVARFMNDDADSVNGDFMMTRGVSVSGRVVDSESGEPIEGTLEYYAAESNKTLSTWNDQFRSTHG